MMRTQMMKRSAAVLTAVGLGFLGVVASPASPASAAVAIDLCATTGASTMPDGRSVPVWGYVLGDCAGNPTVITSGGPVLEVNEGEDVTINLHNNVGVDTALLFQGQAIAPDLVGVAPGEMTSYVLPAAQAGTYLYEAGPLSGAQYQAAMGLHGALVVASGTANQAYADPSTAYDSDEVLVLSEIDPALNDRLNPAGFDMRSFNPRYSLINGQAHPDVPSIVATMPNEKVLLRYVNAGVTYHSMGVLGSRQTVIALDGSPLAYARHYTADTIGPGQTLDSIVVAPAPADTAQSVSVYDASLLLHNSNLGGPGGMYTSIDVGANTPAGADSVGPVASAVAYDGTTLTATLTDAAGTVLGAEYYLDDPSAATGVALPMAAVDASFGSATEDVTAAAAIGGGQHVLYVRGVDDAGNYGALSSVLVTGADPGGPTTSSPKLTPNVANGTVDVSVSATGDDSASGNSNIVAAEYFIDAQGADEGGVSLAVNKAAPIASLDGKIDAGVVTGLVDGPHVIYIHAQDASGAWGDAITVNLDVDKTGPSTSGVLVEKTPNNGTIPYNSSVPGVRVTATNMDDGGAGGHVIKKAEMFLGTVGGNGTGVPLVASDGLFDGVQEGGYADIPLSTVKQLTNGYHDIYVHAKDEAGNWGATASARLLVDKTAPVLSGAALTPNPTAGATQLALTATVTDAWTAPSAAEWFIGTDPGVGKGTALSGFSKTGAGPYTVSGTVDIGVRSEGGLSVRVRVRDGAGNWSVTTTVPVTVTAPLYYSTVGNTNPPSAGGTADNADVYYYPGTGNGHTRVWDATQHGVPSSANLDGFDRVDSTHFYVSFAPDNTNIAGFGTVQDEDVLYYNNGTWSVYFNGTSHGLTGGGRDIDAINIVGGELYFSTRGNGRVPGAGGTADDADIYKWSGSAFSRVFDASANGLPGNADVDGLVWRDSGHQYFSFVQNSTSVPGLGNVPDEDVVYRSADSWTRYFDGSAHGLSNSNAGIDAFDLP